MIDFGERNEYAIRDELLLILPKKRRKERSEDMSMTRDPLTNTC